MLTRDRRKIERACRRFVRDLTRLEVQRARQEFPILGGVPVIVNQKASLARPILFVNRGFLVELMRPRRIA